VTPSTTRPRHSVPLDDVETRTAAHTRRVHTHRAMDGSHGWRATCRTVKPTPYQITVRGPLSATPIRTVDGPTAGSSAAAAVLCSEIADEATLFGLPARIDSTERELVDVRPVVSAG
jgi:hypothetical protein